MKSSGIKFAFAEKLTDRYPELANEQPVGWPAGFTWENSEGLYKTSRKEIFVARKHKSYDPANPFLEISQRQRATLFHETGHGLDTALNYPSRKQDWQDAHAKDVAQVTDKDKARLGYFLQPGHRGWEETFAELQANELGESTALMDVRKYFPECLKLLRSIIGALK